ncbi:MAG: Lysine exporter protein LysE/YggA [Burkholderiaceae bacterium]|jgi:homoserine/homoserine lactone efflux protein|nr:MAG: Lysine exporter protein LysE/YggA [Burkholderiaceae bacterium]
MSLHVWLAFFVASWLIALSPGPGAVLSMSHGLSYGVRRTSATIAGLELGLAFILLVAGAGVGTLLIASARAFMVVKLVGAAYLIWLGAQQWRARVEPGGGDRVPDAQDAPDALSLRQRVLRGALTNATNPKGIVFMVAVLPQFIDPARPLAAQLAILLATTIGVDVLVMHGYAWAAARLSAWLRSAHARRAQNRVFGGVLMGMGASLLLVGRIAKV